MQKHICCCSFLTSEFYDVFFSSISPLALLENCAIFFMNRRIIFMVYFCLHLKFFMQFYEFFMRNSFRENSFHRHCEIENIFYCDNNDDNELRYNKNNKNHWKFAENERLYLERIWTLSWTLKFLRLFTNGCIFSFIFHFIGYFIKTYSDLKWSPIKHLIYKCMPYIHFHFL